MGLIYLFIIIAAVWWYHNYYKPAHTACKSADDCKNPAYPVCGADGYCKPKSS